MAHKSGDVYITSNGAYLFVDDCKGKTKLIILFSKERPIDIALVSEQSSEGNIEWIKQYGEIWPKINITNLFKEVLKE
jgi:hypothetical protein